MTTLCTVDLDAGPIIVEMDGSYLHGSCNRCGDCCSVVMDGSACQHLAYESVDSTPLYKCGIYHSRPIGCVLWPRTDQTIVEGCGFYWTDTSG